MDQDFHFPAGRRVDISASTPDPDLIRTAGTIIRANGLVVFPAKCLYGLAVDARDPVSVEKVFAAKRRPKDNPILVLVPDLALLEQLVADIPETARILMDRFWPGNLTIVFRARRRISPLITAGTGKIGIRIPAHPVARALVREVNRPITGTSANISGEPGCRRVSDLPAGIVAAADLILDAGTLKGGKGSSVVDITGPDAVVLRQGEISIPAIHAALNRTP